MYSTITITILIAMALATAPEGAAALAIIAFRTQEDLRGRVAQLEALHRISRLASEAGSLGVTLNQQTPGHRDGGAQNPGCHIGLTGRSATDSSPGRARTAEVSSSWARTQEGPKCLAHETSGTTM